MPGPLKGENQRQGAQAQTNQKYVLVQCFFDCQFRKVVLFVLQKCKKYCVVIGGRSIYFEISGCAIDLIDGAKYKRKRKQLFVIYALP